MDHHSQTSSFRSALIVVMGLLTGLSTIAAIISYHAYFASQENFEALRVQSLRIMQRSLLLYGDIESVDPTHSTVTIRFRNQFVATEDPVLLTVHITEKTQIVRESLVGINGSYTSINEEPKKRIADLYPGMRVSALLDNVPDKQRIDAQYIFFGNPL